jgi:hypothetical protein
MGYIQQSDTKKIYAYLTQLGKEKFIIGELEDFQVKYFSLHDDDINYYISAKNISASTYNTLKSGFISDVTGDDDICLSSISDATLLKNKLVYFPPVVVDGEYTVFTSCTDTVGSESFSISVYRNPIPQGYSWYVKIDTISFPNSNSTINDANVITSTTTEKYLLNSPPKSFPASMKRSIPNGNGGFVTVLLDDKFLPREADAYNFTVYVVDSSDNVVFTKEFKNINCSKKLFAVGLIDPEVLSDVDATAFGYVYNSPMPIEEIDNLRDVNGEKLSLQKTGFGLWVVDNGNRRHDLNFTQQDLDNDWNGQRYFGNSFGLRSTVGVNHFPDVAGPATLPNGYNNIRITWHVESYNPNDFYPTLLVDRAITRPSIIKSPLMPNGDWQNNAPTITENTYQSILPQGYNPATFTERIDTLHPTVRLFQDWKNGSEGFTFIYYEQVLRADRYPLQTSPTIIPAKKAGTTFGYSFGRIVSLGAYTVNTYGSITDSITYGNPAIVSYDNISFTFDYCVLLQGNYQACFP